MSIFATIWIVVGICIVAGTALYHGYTNACDYDIHENMPCAVCIALLWPGLLMLALAIIAVALPIAGLIQLGKFIRSKTR